MAIDSVISLASNPINIPHNISSAIIMIAEEGILIASPAKDCMWSFTTGRMATVVARAIPALILLGALVSPSPGLVIMTALTRQIMITNVEVSAARLPLGERRSGLPIKSAMLLNQ